MLFLPGNPQDFIKVWTVQTLVHPGLSYPSVSDGKQNPVASHALPHFCLLQLLLSGDSLLRTDVSSPSSTFLHILTAAWSQAVFQGFIVQEG